MDHDPTQDVTGAIDLVAQADLIHKVGELTQALLVGSWTGGVIGRHSLALERGRVAFDGRHQVV